MDTTSLQSTLNKAREQFENGHAKACVETLKGVLGDLKVGEPEWYRLRNDTSFLLARLSGLERERGMISEQNYMVEWNKLFYSTNQLVLDFEAGVREMGPTQTYTVIKPITYPAELTLSVDYEKTKLEEIIERISNIEKMLRGRTGLNERIEKITSGSVIVKLNLYAEEIIKIKSLVKLKIVDSALDFKVLNPAWDWIKEENFVLQLGWMNLHGAKLNKANLSGGYLRAAKLVSADLHGADLSGADIFGANLNAANLNGADLNGACLQGADLISANLRNADLRNVDLRGADLSSAYLVGADLNGVSQRGTKLTGAIFQTNQLEILKSMKVDISQLIFLDDEGKKVERGVEMVL